MLRDTVARVLGSSNRDVERLQELTLNPDGSLLIWWTINDSLTNGMIKTGARIDIKEILQALDESGVGFTQVTLRGSFPLTDAYGATEEAYVVRAVYSRATIDRIEWANFLHRNVYVVADEVTLHPAFRED